MTRTPQRNAPGRFYGWLGALRAMITFSFSGDPTQGAVMPILQTGWAAGPAFPAPMISQPQGPTIEKAITELLAAKLKSGRRPKTLENLRQHLRVFAKGREKTPIGSVTLDDVEEFVALGKSQWAQATRLAVLSCWFSFAIRRGWLVSNLCERIERVSIDHRPPAIFDPKTCERILHHADPDARPWIVLGLFVGLRPTEALRVGWRDIRWDEKVLVVDSAASKVRQRRIVPLDPAAVAWLELDRKSEGIICPSHATVRRRRRELTQALGIQWPQDVARHTCASMRIARGDDPAKVASELGNSVRILLTHYRELVHRKDAERFWAIRPKGGAA